MNKQHQQDNQKSITETYSPRYRRGDFNNILLSKFKQKSVQNISDKQLRHPIQEGILNNFNQITSYLNQIDQLFRSRMQVHQQEIIQIAHSQIKKIQGETQKIVRKYSQLIKDRNINTQILDLKYQVLYYQQRACEMFEENKKLKNQLKSLRQQVQQLKFGEETNHLAMHKISKAYLKQKTIRKKMQIGQFRSVLNQGRDSNIKISMLSRISQEKSLLSLTKARDQGSSLKKSYQIKTKPELSFFTTNIRPTKPAIKKLKLKSITQSTQDQANPQPSNLLFPLV